MTPVDRELLEQAVGWARAAGDLTLAWFRGAELGTEHKDDGSPVTAADKAAERFLREAITDAYPLDTIRGEEEDDHTGTSGRCWVIDPIDGTRAFKNGVGLYSILLYLEDADGPAIGIINLPALGETVYAARGLGCFLNGQRCGVSERPQLRGSYLSTTWFDEWSPEQFSAVQHSGLQLRTWGDAYGYALVASGRIEAMYDPALAWWDLAALLVIIPEAGGTITSASGGPADIPVGDGEYAYSAVASNGLVHDQIVQVLHPAGE
ncbi:MAG: inositol monophosphatase family protein [Actinomycetes bacterium]